MISPFLEAFSNSGGPAADAAGWTASGSVAPSPPTETSAGGSVDDGEVIVFPATAAQRRFWLLDQLVPGGNPALNMPLAIRLRGSLDVSALENSFNEIIGRHEALRTTFHYEKGDLLQVISPAVRVRIPVVDANDFPLAERGLLAAHIMEEEARRPFDLANGPLVRARLVRLQPSEHLLVFPAHHIVVDGWSNGIFVRELGALYTALAGGEEPPLPEPGMHFADFSQWQNDLLASGGFEGQLRYWRNKLGGELPVLDLPTHRPRLAWRGQAAPAAIRTRDLPAAVGDALKRLASREGCSPFMLTLTAFAVLLDRYSGGQEDLVIATSTANRQRLELENIIGLFVNPLLLRLDLGGAPTWRELLGRTRGVVLEAFENADVPFERVLEEVRPRRLQVNFLYQQDFLQADLWRDLRMSPEEPGSGGAVYEWNMIVLDDGKGLRLHCEYNAELFSAPAIDQVLADYEALLVAVSAESNLDLPVCQLPLSSGERAEPDMHALRVERWRLPDSSLVWLREHFAPAPPPAVSARCETLPGRAVAVLDGHDQPTPAGVPGELCLIVPGAQKTLVKTGDIAIRQPDRSVRWIGPSGTECKVDGLRVDRQFVEAAISAHPHVKRAVVLWRDGQDDKPSLTAYYEGDDAPAALCAPSEIRGFLQDDLPEEWLPGAFVPLKAFPMTPDGTLDQAGLPAGLPDPKDQPADTHAIPYLALHHQIIEIWREMLPARNIGIRDDFFALGGNSLLAMRMLYRLEQTFGKALLPATLFQRATIEHLADEILKTDGEIGSREIVRVQEGGSKTPVFFLHGDIAGGGFYCAKLARDLGPDQPFYALPPAEVDRPLEDRPTVEGMAAAHVAMIRSVRAHGPYVIGGFCIGGVIAYEMACQLERQGETVEKVLIIDAEPTHHRLALVRAGVECWARLRVLDKNRQLYLFCRWYHWLARWDDLRRLGVRAQAVAAWAKFSRVFRRRETREQVPVATPEESATGWFDARLDVPLVFLWALGAYRARPYAGQVTLLLSSDLLEGAEGGGTAAAWENFVPRLAVEKLQGAHLACITEHVAELAATVRRVLGG